MRKAISMTASETCASVESCSIEPSTELLVQRRDKRSACARRRQRYHAGHSRRQELSSKRLVGRVLREGIREDVEGLRCGCFVSSAIIDLNLAALTAHHVAR